MSYRFARYRTVLVASALAASIAVGFAQTPRGTASPEREVAPRADAQTPGSAVADPRKPQHPVVNDARLTASPKVRYIGPSGTTSPFGSTNMTENQCRDMERCQVVQGQGPSYATWCRCDKAKLTTFTYIHD
jgi:hypothetical protein